MQPYRLDPLEDSLRLLVFLARHKHYQPHDAGWRRWPFWVVLSVIEGEYSFFTRQPNGRCTAQPGESLVLRPGVPHRVAFSGGGVLMVMHLRFTACSGLDVLSPYHFSQAIRGAAAADIQQTQASLVPYYRTNCEQSFRAFAHRRELGMRLLRLLLQNADEPERPLSSYYAADWLAPVLGYIHENLDQPIRREDLTRVAGLSASHFSTRFCEAIGTPPMHYVRRVRLQRAMEFLTASDLTVTEIAARLAFCDPYHFSKQFKAETGLSPRQYRIGARATLREHEA